MSRVLIALLACAAIAITAESAKILGVFPIPSISHQIVFRALTLELVKRGHEVVVVTPDPAFKDQEPMANLTEIDTSEIYKVMLETYKTEEFTQKFKRGVIMDMPMLTSVQLKLIPHVVEGMFENPAMKTLLADKKQHFDLVIVEALMYSQLIFSEIFKAPAILFSSFYGTASNFEVVGGVSRHPSYPSIYRKKFKSQTILDKIEQLYEDYKVLEFDAKLYNVENNLLKERFGEGAPTIADLKKNVVLLFTNSHPIFDSNRPVPPGAVSLGAIHMKPVKPLPKDLKSYLDNSTRGVIYVSLGTNVRPSEMEEDFLNAFIEAFEKLPYDILWKFDADSLEGVPKNVKIQKWFPQRDLLGHPNVKAFVMQGGLQSTDEAIDAEVPLVGIPMLADQWFNVNKYVELGIGVSLDSFTMTAKDLVQAVNTVTNDIRNNMQELKAFMQDQPEKSIDRAVWWTEHVLRHKGSRYLLGAAAQMPWSEYLMLDVVVTLAIVFTLLVAVAATAIYYIVKVLLFSNRTVKVKQS